MPIFLFRREDTKKRFERRFKTNRMQVSNCRDDNDVRVKRNERRRKKIERKRLKTVFFLPMPKRCHFVLYEKSYEKSTKK